MYICIYISFIMTNNRQMERLNFNHLYYFYIVAKVGTVREAAEKLHVSQPTISDQLRLLEDFFGCKLFERKNRGLHLTKEGHAALDSAEKIFSLGAELSARLKHKIVPPKSTVDIGISKYMSQYFIYERILPLIEHSDVCVNLHEEDRHILLAQLEEGNIDIIFTTSKESLSPNMSAHRVGLNKTFVVAHKKFKKFKKDFPQCLNNIAFFDYTKESLLKYEIDLFFSQNSITPKIIGQADDVDLFELVTAQGLAFTIVPEVAKDRLCQNKDIIVLGEVEELETSVWGIIKKNYKGLGYKLLKGKL